MPVCRAYRHAGVLSALTIASLWGLLYLNPDVAARIMREDHLVEWVQVIVFGATAVAALVAARRPPPALDLMLALLFAMFVELELDLDRRLLGRAVIDRRFLLDGTNPLGPRLLVALCLLGFGLAVTVYAWRRRRELVRSAVAMVRAPWGHVLLAGLAMLVVVEVFEKPLGRSTPLPKYFAEESVELLAALCCFVALFDHARHDGR